MLSPEPNSKMDELLKAYAKRTKNADRAAADIIGELWVQGGTKQPSR